MEIQAKLIKINHYYKKKALVTKTPSLRQIHNKRSLVGMNS